MSSAAATLDEAPAPPSEALLWSAHLDGSTAARAQLFDLHLPFARRVAWRHHRRSSAGDVEFADLFQLACAGLLEAIDGFDPARGIPFRGYAARRIGGSVMDGLAKLSEIRGQLSFRRRVERDRLASLMERGAPPRGSPDPAGALAELTIGLALGIMLEGTGQYLEGDAVDPAPSPYEGLAFKRMVRRMHDEVARLEERERDILRHHYGEGLAFEQIARLLEISKGRVSQIHRAALLSLRTRLRNGGVMEFEG